MSGETRTLYLWCDTICCPPAPSGCTDRERSNKVLALDRLRDVYQNAAYVLVLERGLANFAVGDVEYLEAGFRLCTSAWMRRLWTSQEAALAYKVLVKYEDEHPVDLAQIWKHLREMGFHGEFRERSIALMTGGRIASLRHYFHKAHHSGPTNVNMIVGALTRRKVTVPSDEALCLSAVFELDTKRVAEASAEMQMAQVWRLLSHKDSGVPDTIVFNTCPRIDQDGLRWAPATVLTHVLDERI